MANNTELEIKLEKQKVKDLIACCLRPGCAFELIKDFNGNFYVWSEGKERIPVRVPVEGKYSANESCANAAILTVETNNKIYVEGMKHLMGSFLKAASNENKEITLNIIQNNIAKLAELGKTNELAGAVSSKATSIISELLSGKTKDASDIQR